METELQEFTRAVDSSERWAEHFAAEPERSHAELAAIASLLQYIHASRQYSKKLKPRAKELVRRRIKIEHACWELQWRAWKKWRR